MSEDSPVMITLAPIERDASTVRTRWLATDVSMLAHPGDVDHHDLGALVRMPRSNWSVGSRRAGCRGRR